MRYLKIKSIKKVGLKRCYDLHVPINNNYFFSNGILSHNSGKTYKLLSTSQYFHANGYKIWDIFGGRRGEGSYWCFPSDEKKLWEEFENEVGEMEKKGPKEYEVDLIFPYFESKFPDKLPHLPPRIISKPMTIFFKEISHREISTVLGEMSQTARYIWNYIVKNLPDSANCEDILALFEPKMPLSKNKETTIFKLFIQPMCENKIFASKNSRFNISFKDEAENKKRIFVLNDDYTPEEFKLFIMSYIMNKIADMVLANEIHKQNILLFREMSLFMKVQDESTDLALQKQALRSQLTDIARYARSGFFIFGDTQSSFEVKSLVSGSEDLLLINELPSQRDREELCDQLKRDRRISDAQIAYISMMPREKMAVVERGKKARLIKRVMPPRNKCWKQGEGNFIAEYKKQYNEFKNINPEKEEILNACKERLFLIEELKSKAEAVKSREDKFAEGEDDSNEDADIEEVSVRNTKLVPDDEVSPELDVKKEIEAIENKEDKIKVKEKIQMSEEQIQGIQNSKAVVSFTIDNKITLSKEEKIAIRKKQLEEDLARIDRSLGGKK